jgi:hypothetical protein
LEGDVSSWANAFYGSSPRRNDSQLLTNRWSVGEGPDRRDYELATWLSYPAATVQAPAVNLRHLTPEPGPSLTVRFASPQFAINRPADEEPLTRANFWLLPGPMHTQPSVRHERVMSAGPVQVETAFYEWAPVVSKTTFLLGWEATHITGLTSEPIALRGYYSQSFAAGHHGWGEEFIFEPRLEPGLPEEQLAELEAANIRLLYVLYGYLGDPTTIYPTTMFILGFDGQVRQIE